MDRIFTLSHHALSRMATRNISNTKVAQTIFCGQIFATGDGKHRAKHWESNGKTVDEYVVVFSKPSSRIITVEHNVKRAKDIDTDAGSKQQLRKIYKQRKRALRDREFDSWCREEYREYSLNFTA